MVSESGKKILIDCAGNIVRVALVEGGRLVELLAEKRESSSIAGNVYAGTVKNISQSQFMFIDIGQEKNAFIYVNDKKECGMVNSDGSFSLKIGDTALVQVIKDAHGDKGATATTKISFTGMFMVVSKVSGYAEIGISKKIESSAERERLKGIMRKITPEGYDVIIRTRSEGRSEEELKAELGGLIGLCGKVSGEWRLIKAPSLVYNAGELIEKAFTELYGDKVEEIVINDYGQFTLLKRAISKIPSFNGAAEKLCYYGDEIPLFSKYGIEKRAASALHKKVWLKSGGFLVIEKTEACHVIDVNTGKFAGGRGHEQSVFKVNKEAAEEIAAQLRLRNLSGIILIDFIDMKQEGHKQAVMDLLRDELKKDRMSNNLYGMTELGLVFITRKKIRDSITDILTEECTACGGGGRVAVR